MCKVWVYYLLWVRCPQHSLHRLGLSLSRQWPHSERMAVVMTCVTPHDNCPLFEETEDHLACLNSHCCWTYVNPGRNAMSDDVVIGETILERPGILVIFDEVQRLFYPAEKRAHGPVRE